MSWTLAPENSSREPSFSSDIKLVRISRDTWQPRRYVHRLRIIVLSKSNLRKTDREIVSFFFFFFFLYKHPFPRNDKLIDKSLQPKTDRSTLWISVIRLPKYQLPRYRNTKISIKSIYLAFERSFDRFCDCNFSRNISNKHFERKAVRRTLESLEQGAERQERIGCFRTSAEGPVCRSDAAVMSTNIYLIGSAAARRDVERCRCVMRGRSPSFPFASQGRRYSQYYLRTCPSVVGKAIGYNRLSPPSVSIGLTFFQPDKVSECFIRRHRTGRPILCVLPI